MLQRWSPIPRVGVVGTRFRRCLRAANRLASDVGGLHLQPKSMDTHGDLRQCRVDGPLRADRNFPLRILPAKSVASGSCTRSSRVLVHVKDARSGGRGVTALD